VSLMLSCLSYPTRHLYFLGICTSLEKIEVTRGIFYDILLKSGSTIFAKPQGTFFSLLFFLKIANKKKTKWVVGDVEACSKSRVLNRA